MRVSVPLLAVVLWVVPAAFSQSSDWRQCLPFPSFAEELAEGNGVEFQITVELKGIHFVGANNLPVRDQRQIAASLKQVKYTVQWNNQEAWVADLAERVRDEWQRHGYYAARVNKIERNLLASFSGRALVSVTVDLQEGPQYRLGTLTFRNNKRFSSEQLRGIFPLRDGEIFATDKIRQGLENLRTLYGTVGYINMTAVPNEYIDRLNNRISLDVDLDEGSEYRVGKVRILGLPNGVDEKSSVEQLGLKSGDVYNQARVSSFDERVSRFMRNLPESTVPQSQRTIRNSTHTVDIVIDLSNPEFHCPDWGSLYVDR